VIRRLVHRLNNWILRRQLQRLRPGEPMPDDSLSTLEDTLRKLHLIQLALAKFEAECLHGPLAAIPCAPQMASDADGLIRSAARLEREIFQACRRHLRDTKAKKPVADPELPE
jgi:hypothetical protein